MITPQNPLAVPSENPSSDRGSQPPGETVAPPLAPVRGTNPQLTSTLAASLEALRNDVEQARAMAADFQHELAGKSNECAHHKALFDKTRHDMLQLQASVAELREERHRLANEAMRAAALELRLQKMTTERDRLLQEVAELQRARTTESETCVRELVAEMAALRKEVSGSRAHSEVTYVTDEVLPGRKRTQEFIRMSYQG